MVRSAISAALALLLLSGCGKDGAQGDGAAKQTSNATPTPTPKTTANPTAKPTSTATAQKITNQPTTPAEFAGVLLEGLAKNDEELFKRYYQQDMILLIPFVRRLVDAEAKKKGGDQKPWTDEEVSERLKENKFPRTIDAFPALRSEGEMLGIDWSQVLNVKPEQWRPTDNFFGIPLADCRVTFESKGSKFVLDVGDVSKVGDKWFSNRLSVGRN